MDHGAQTAKDDRMESIDRLYLDRAYELAARGIGNTSPNPAVGAVVVRDGAIVGEGYHHRAGEPHAEVNALEAAGDLAQGATLYVSLEPCNHEGRTPPCTQAILRAGIARVVIGTADPNPLTERNSGLASLREAGVAIEVAGDTQAFALIEPFARAISAKRPFVTLKMACSLDGFVAAQHGRQEWLTGPQARDFVRDLRITHDAVAVGAGTVRIDNPQLTVRPAHDRLRPYVRVVVCENDTVDAGANVFVQQEGYARTMVLAPAGLADRFSNLRGVADVVFVGDEGSTQLDVREAFRSLYSRGISAVVCEGGPTMAGTLFGKGLVDRFCWIVAPRLLRTQNAVPVLASGNLFTVAGLRFDRLERLGDDVLISGIVDRDV